MKAFMGEHFLLQNEVSRRLYHDYAAKQPIIDYHCHLNPQEIYEDKRFGNLAEIWLYGDHYKWRAMRANGIEEALVTGDRGRRLRPLSRLGENGSRDARQSAVSLVAPRVETLFRH